MRIGVGPFPLERRPEQPLDAVYRAAFAWAELAETVGLDAVWVDGNHFTEEAHGPSPLLVAAGLAARTRRVALGVATLTLSVGEHPLHTAEEALTLDLLSGGRLILGVGVGYRDEELRGFGIGRDERRARFDDALAILRAAFDEPTRFPYRGKAWQVERPVTPYPRPVRPGGPPIWIGGGWQPGAVRRVARLGAPLISQFFEEPARIAAKMALYREAAAPDAAGLHTVPAIRDVVLAKPEHCVPALLEVYRRYASWGMPLLGRPTRPDEIGPREVEAIALLGDERRIAERLDELSAVGVSDVLARVDLPGIRPEQSEQTIHALGALRRTSGGVSAG